MSFRNYKDTIISWRRWYIQQKAHVSFVNKSVKIIYAPMISSALKTVKKEMYSGILQILF